jgi:hypothetical protein
MSKPTCLISGPVFNRSGYGDWATDIAKSMIRYDKFDVMIAPQKWGHCPSKRFMEDLTDPDDKILATKFIQGPLNKQPDLFIQLTIPEEFNPVGKYNIGMTAGIETTIPPGSWLEGVNRMDVTLALSNHAKDILANVRMAKKLPNGQQVPVQIEKPMEVCFWGANTDIFKKTDEKIESVESAMSIVKEKKAFLFVGQWTHGGLYNDRKDIGNLIKTFCKSFIKNSPEDRPALVLKTNGVNHSTIDRFECLQRIKQIRDSVGENAPNVYLLHGELNNQEMNALFNHEKIIAHVSFTHGEGYGHPLLLASLSGKPMIVSNWSGHLDFLNEKYVNLLPGALDQIPRGASNNWIVPESKWFKVAYGLAEDKFKHMYQYHNTEKIQTKAEELRKENMEKFSISSMDKQFWSLLDKYVPQFAVENKFVLPKLKMVGDNDAQSEPQKIVLPKLKLV